MLLYNEEYDIVTEKILKVVSTYHPAMEQAGMYIAELDLVNSFAITTIKN